MKKQTPKSAEKMAFNSFSNNSFSSFSKKFTAATVAAILAGSAREGEHGGMADVTPDFDFSVPSLDEAPASDSDSNADSNATPSDFTFDYNFDDVDAQ